MRKLYWHLLIIWSLGWLVCSFLTKFSLVDQPYFKGMEMSCRAPNPMSRKMSDDCVVVGGNFYFCSVQFPLLHFRWMFYLTRLTAFYFGSTCRSRSSSWWCFFGNLTEFLYSSQSFICNCHRWFMSWETPRTPWCLHTTSIRWPHSSRIQGPLMSSWTNSWREEVGVSSHIESILWEMNEI